MQRRQFFAIFTRLVSSVAALPLASVPLSAVAATRRVHLQTSPVAGFQHHQGEAAWPGLRAGQPLSLRREPGNRFDPRAIEVWAGPYKLGYVPRVDNCAASQLMDRDAKLFAQITVLERSDNPWRRVQFVIEFES